MPSEVSVLRVFVPSLPSLPGHGWNLNSVLGVAEQLFLANCAERLVEIAEEGTPSLSLLTSCSVSQDGHTYRLELRKDCTFHDGSEITATDVIRALDTILFDPKSPCQLHHFLPPLQGDFRHRNYPLKRLSRYRFELRLTQDIPDFLERLATLEASMFKTESSGETVFSGPWKVTSRSERVWLLEPHQGHRNLKNCPYTSVRLEVIDKSRTWDHLLGGDPYLFVYPGTLMRSFDQTMVRDDNYAQLTSGYACLMVFEKALPGMDWMRHQLEKAAAVCFSYREHWRRKPLTSLCPKGHILHAPIPQRECRTPVPLPAIRIGVASSLFDSVLLTKFQETCRNFGITITFVPTEPGTEDSEVDGWIVEHYVCHPFDSLSPLTTLPNLFSRAKPIHKAVVEQTQKLANLVNRNHRIAKSKQLARDIFDDPRMIPMLWAPNICHTNQGVDNANNRWTINFCRLQPQTEKSAQQRMRLETLAAVGAAVQMFAHDVKKPFSMIEGLLSLMEDAQDFGTVRDLIQRYAPDVKRTIHTVNGMIEDVVAIGSDLSPLKEATSLEDLIELSLVDVFRHQPDADIQFEYALRHRHKAYIDNIKILRVLNNLIGNACQAMKGKGRIWFISEETTGEDASFVRLTVGNSGSFIPPEEARRVFQLFYTKGKKKGTGLGLAIAERIVAAHGGSIWCRSDAERGTEFIFEMPVALTHPYSPDSQNLPSHSHEIIEVPTSIATAPATPRKQPASDAGASIDILVVDDETVYINLLRDLLEKCQERWGCRIEVLAAHSSEEALAMVREHTPYLLVIDVDLGSKSINGFELVSKLRARGVESTICIHSNRAPEAYRRNAMEVGADAFLRKPMTEQHLEGLIWGIRDIAKPVLHKPLILAVLDDDVIFLEGWETQKDIYCHTFDHPKQFLELLDSHPDLVQTFDGVICDYYFDGHELTGVDIAQRLKERFPNLPIFLSTDRKSLSDDTLSHFRLQISKNVKEALAAVRQCLL